MIWAFEKLGWAWDARWPDEERLATRRPVGAKRVLGSMTKGAMARRASVKRARSTGEPADEKSIKAASQADRQAA